MPSRVAARVKLRSSATARKYRKRRSSKSLAFLSLCVRYIDSVFRYRSDILDRYRVLPYSSLVTPHPRAVHGAQS
jgi:hypothetical protein